MFLGDGPRHGLSTLNCPVEKDKQDDCGGWEMCWEVSRIIPLPQSWNEWRLHSTKYSNKVQFFTVPLWRSCRRVEDRTFGFYKRKGLQKGLGFRVQDRWGEYKCNMCIYIYILYMYYDYILRYPYPPQMALDFRNQEILLWFDMIFLIQRICVNEILTDRW